LVELHVRSIMDDPGTHKENLLTILCSRQTKEHLRHADREFLHHQAEKLGVETSNISLGRRSRLTLTGLEIAVA
jgi:hypothetical protein